jgi:hypothetical protein
VAYLAPPAGTWAAALAGADRHGDLPHPCDDPAFDTGTLLPFVDGDAHLVAVELPEEWT